ncbi:MAG: LamG domain-containing protein, partial [Planctomycetota bacterium]
MNGKLVFLTSLIVLLSCFSAAKAGFEVKVDIAKGKTGPLDPGELPYEEWTAKEGWLAWHQYSDGLQHDGTSKENIGGTGLTVGICIGDGSSTPGTVLNWTSSSDDPLCNTWIMSGAEDDGIWGPGYDDAHLCLSGPGLVPGTYWVYAYHNTPPSEPCMPDNMPRAFVTTFYGDYYRENMGAPNDVDNEGVIVESNDVDVPVQHETLDDNLTTSLVKFYTDGSPVMITYEALGDPNEGHQSGDSMGILNAFRIVQTFATATAGDPFPAYEEEYACPNTALTWESGLDANTHKVYFDPNLTEELSIFNDNLESGDANWVPSNWTIYDSNVLGDGNSDGNAASAYTSFTPGSGSGTLTSVDIDTSEAGSMRVSLSIKHTLGVEAGDIDLYYYNGSGWDYIADLNAVGPNDVWRTYTDDVNESQYLIGNFKLQLRSSISAGEVFVDNVSVTNTWPILSEWLVYSGPLNSYDPPGNLDFDKTYYWRVDEVNDACSASPWEGYLWNFTTESGKARDPDPEDHAGFKPVEGIQLQWTPSCLATDGDYVYLSTDFDEVNDSNLAVRSSLLSTPSYSTGALEYAAKYYWKVNGIGAGALPEGDVWSFQTTGYPLMHYDFDGVLDANVHDLVDANVITDSAGNVTFYVSTNESESGVSELRYGEPNPLYNWLGTSAHFITTEPGDDDDGTGSSLLRNCFGPDLLDLDGLAYTIEAWVRQDGSAADVDDDDMEGTIIRKDSLAYGLGIDDDGTVKFMHNGNVIESERGRITRGEWHHIAAVYDSSDPCRTEKLYVDGIVAADNNSPEPNPQDDGSDYVGIGAYRWEGEVSPGVSNYLNGAIDELKVIDIALTPGEFLIRGDRGVAWLPQPGNGQPNIASDANLIWRPGDLATSHDVYLGTDWDDVNDADTTTVGVYQDNVGPNTFDPVFLAMKTTWYWRVDEVDDSNGYVWKGHVWRFRTADFLALDDFESYHPTDNRIYYT